MADPATIATLGVLSASIIGAVTLLGKEREKREVIIKEKDYVNLDYGDRVQVFPIHSSQNPTLPIPISKDYVELEYEALDGQIKARYYL